MISTLARTCLMHGPSYSNLPGVRWNLCQYSPHSWSDGVVPAIDVRMHMEVAVRARRSTGPHFNIKTFFLSVQISIVYLIRYYRLSIYHGFIWYNSAHSTRITMIKLRSDLHSRMTPHTSPLWVSYGVSFMSYTKKIDRDISWTHCNKEIKIHCHQLCTCAVMFDYHAAYHVLGWRVTWGEVGKFCL